jgi:hypothetical protein
MLDTSHVQTVYALTSETQITWGGATELLLDAKVNLATKNAINPFRGDLLEFNCERASQAANCS